MNKFKHIHFIGIKGVAMTALAILAKKQGSKITGSDTEEEFITDPVLKKFKINWDIGFSEKNIKGEPDLVVVTGAHGGMTNKEAMAAKLMGLNVMMHGQALGVFMDGYKQISVTGCHGKTTTSALIATLLAKGGLSPSYAIGCANIPILNTPSDFGKGEYFIAEADEYVTCPKTDNTPRFLWQNPSILVINNIEYDHPDVYKNIEEVKMAFWKIIEKIPNDGVLIAGIDNKNLQEMIPKVNKKIITFGQSPNASWRIKRISSPLGSTRFWLEYKNREVGEFKLSIPGSHNCQNALASIIVALECGMSLENINKILPQFTGTKRRFEFINEVNKIKLYDDYAHHPTEIMATLKSAREWFPDSRIICIFQPHTYSRTKLLFEDFKKAFNNADIAIITDIYSSSREKKKNGMSGNLLAQEINNIHGNTIFLKGENEILNYLEINARPGDIIFTMGAGDIFKWHKSIIEAMKIVKN